MEKQPEFTVDSLDISPTPAAAKVGGIESKMMIKGLETPKDRSELYDNFDIHH